MLLLATVAAAASKPCTMFDPSNVPTVVDSGPEAGVEVGVKFKSDVNGIIHAIRFYKASTNTGPHVARLWTISGALLASQRFATRIGAVIDVYQAATQMTDESGQSYPLTINTLLDNALGPLGYYGVFTANIHADNADSMTARSIVASALSRGVPIVSALQILQWLDGRNGSFFSTVNWKDDTLTFKVSAAPGANGLSVLLLANGPSGRLAGISRNGSAVPYNALVVKGIEYVVFAAGSGGSFQASYRFAPRN
jgi:uncharacterized protein DUF4082